LAFLSQNKAKFWKKLIITLVFEKNGNFSAKNCRKSQKIVIITSTPELGLHFQSIINEINKLNEFICNIKVPNVLRPGWVRTHDLLFFNFSVFQFFNFFNFSGCFGSSRPCSALRRRKASQVGRPGTDIMIFKMFTPIFLAKKNCRFWLKTKVNYARYW
jgi:hypothetical protein